MGLIQELSKAITPHREKFTEDMAFQGAALHNRLKAIENAVSDLGRGDIGNKWQRFVINRKFLAGETFEITVAPINEMMLIQAIASDGVQEKSPPFIIEANNVLIESIIKEGLGFEGIGGNQILLPGEKLTITARAEGNINCVITVIRREYPVVKKFTDMGRNTDRYSPKGTHDISRDEIASRTGRYDEKTAELAATEGRQG